MNLSNYAEERILRHCLGLIEFPMPAAVYVALSNIESSELESGDLTGEPDGAGYDRQPVTFLVDGIAENVEDIIHTATDDWGVLTTVAITDAAVGGNTLLYSAMPSIAINQNEHKFPAGALTVSIEGSCSSYLSEHILRHLLGIEAFPMPTATYLVIMDKNLQEISGGGYVRQLCTFDTDGRLSEPVFFPLATAPWSSKAYYVGITDAVSNILFLSSLIPQVEVTTGGELYFKSNDGLILTVN